MGYDDKAENKGEELGGKLKEGAGRLTGDDEMQAEGKADQSKGKVKQGAEHAKDAVKDVKDGLTK